MNFFEIFSNKTESVGKFECNGDSIASAFTQLASKVGITNPAHVATSANKGVVITKKGDKFVIKLLMFTPPLEIEWSEIRPLSQLQDTLLLLAEQEKRKIGYVNFTRLQTGQKFFQLAIGK